MKLTDKEKIDFLPELISEYAPEDSVVTLAQMQSILNTIGLNRLKNSFLDLKPGDLFIYPGDEKKDSLLHICYKPVPENIVYSDLKNYLIPLNSILFPKDMKKMKSKIHMKGYRLRSSDANPRQGNLVSNLKNGNLAIAEDVYVDRTYGPDYIEVSYNANMERNFLHLTLALIKKRILREGVEKYSDDDLSPDIRYIDILIKKIWNRKYNGTSHHYIVESISGVNYEKYKNNIIIDISSRKLEKPLFNLLPDDAVIIDRPYTESDVDVTEIEWNVEFDPQFVLDTPIDMSIYTKHFGGPLDTPGSKIEALRIMMQKYNWDPSSLNFTETFDYKEYMKNNGVYNMGHTAAFIIAHILLTMTYKHLNLNQSDIDITSRIGSWDKYLIPPQYIEDFNKCPNFPVMMVLDNPNSPNDINIKLSLTKYELDTYMTKIIDIPLQLINDIRRNPKHPLYKAGNTFVDRLFDKAYDHIKKLMQWKYNMRYAEPPKERYISHTHTIISSNTDGMVTGSEKFRVTSWYWEYEFDGELPKAKLKENATIEKIIADPVKLKPFRSIPNLIYDNIMSMCDNGYSQWLFACNFHGMQDNSPLETMEDSYRNCVHWIWGTLASHSFIHKQHPVLSLVVATLDKIVFEAMNGQNATEPNPFGFSNYTFREMEIVYPDGKSQVVKYPVIYDLLNINPARILLQSEYHIPKELGKMTIKTKFKALIDFRNLFNSDDIIEKIADNTTIDEDKMYLLKSGFDYSKEPRENFDDLEDISVLFRLREKIEDFTPQNTDIAVVAAYETW